MRLATVFALFCAFILGTSSFAQNDCSGDCQGSHPYFLCGQCWENIAQAQQGGCQETCSQEFSGNPIDLPIFTADPSVRVYDDKLWLMPSHDPNNAPYWTMMDYVVFSTEDLVNWQEEGTALSVGDVTWGGAWLYAPDFILRNGTYYLYFPKTEEAIGVATSDHPAGPYEDALGVPLIDQSQSLGAQRTFDPGIFIDDDEQAYLVFGGGDNGTDGRIVKLKEDMVTLDGAIQKVEGLDRFFEAPYLHKHNGLYYLTYSAKYDWYTTIDYATSANPIGPYTHRGTLLGSVNGWTNHHSVIEFRGQWYLFYHVADGSDYTRRTCADYLYYNEDGSMEEVIQTSQGVAKVSPIITSLPNDPKEGRHLVNVVSNVLNLKVSSDYQLYDMLGNKVRSGRDDHILLQGLAKGMYFLKREGEVLQPFLKQ